MTVQELFKRYNLTQRDLTQALAKWKPPISRSYAHYVWHGTKPPSLNVILAIRRAFEMISDAELFELLEQTRGRYPDVNHDTVIGRPTPPPSERGEP
jgi:transcriptional regulator with XRE-family HTH domain